ncbi:trehalase [Coprinopsis marcescibilis]|uniref:Trehalase n=1 Tax=Coprinopsis marcescibilis TaxID=230819 RepID=A0A5C3L4Z5_COPMA|nr:trehalase [Coprinopsis marcescibilis]
MAKLRATWLSLYSLWLAGHALAQNSSEPPTITVVTARPTPSAPLDQTLPSQAALPPRQEWCPSEIFCAGPLLQTVNVAHVYPDDKTFIDKASSPTSKPAREVLNDFQNISTGTTYGQIVTFLENDFTGEGLELQALALPSFNPNPAFLNNVSDPLCRGFSQAVHGFWTQLIRGTNESTLCGTSGRCESTLIPLNHTFVVPGGRFREQYYWDSFWILEGLLESELFDIANATLQNFMDELDTIGFIPNGGRIYYLNRSQPPVFIQMLARYVEVSGDRGILARGIPLAEKELTWWSQERSVSVTSPFTNATHQVYHYAVTNSAPRPESYLTDYLTANSPDLPPLNETERADLYAELASGAESGWDYSARWYSAGGNSLRALDVRATIAVDLNSIIYRSHIVLADLYGSNSTGVNRHRRLAAELRLAIIDLLWDPEKLGFYDFSLTTNDRNTIFTAAHFYPFWSGIFPDEVLASEEAAFGAFSSIHLVLNRYNGTYPSTFVDSHLQWDAPNTWPPHQYIALQALRGLPANVSSGPLPQPAEGESTFSLVPSGQLGLEENELPGQPITFDQNATATGTSADINRLNGTVFNGGNSTEGEGWAAALGRELANRYFASTLCSWHATGGAIEGILPRLSEAELRITQSVDQNGHMFEKFSNLDIDSAGRGGEYVAGFGWTNGVALWVASNYGGALVVPQCPNLLEVPTGPRNTDGAGSGSSTIHQMPYILFAVGCLLSYLF